MKYKAGGNMLEVKKSKIRRNTGTTPSRQEHDRDK
jgi:hypothetical protein